jgi:hypothetical protein
MVTTAFPETRNTIPMSKIDTYKQPTGKGDTYLFNSTFFPLLRPKTSVEPVSSTTSGSAAVYYLLPVEQTTAYYFDREMLQLERAVMLEDEGEFVRLVNTIDWQICPAEDHLQAVRLALQVGAHLTARRLSQEGVVRYPENPEMVKYADVLAPVKTIRTDLPSDPGVGKNNHWLKQHHDDYGGLWVALRDGELLAEGMSFKEVKQQVGALKNSRILVTKVY